MPVAAAEVPVVAIDGPGGSGKGTVARAVARALGWHMLDSGALYRVVGLAASQQRMDWEDTAGLARVARDLAVVFDPLSGDEGRIVLAGSDVSAAIREEAAGHAASRVAAVPAVREALVDRQRRFRRPPGLVADGRDMGSVIFPDARLKVFLTASVEERALRRYKQLKQKGIDVSLPALSKDMAERDRRDAERAVAPLRASPDARILDTTGLGVAEVVVRVLHWVGEAYPGLARREGPDA
ncbi:MAG: (d)CMP kinase [Gammaproteobacteria bacterium]|nr:(d)CMP kinase [Gammaproteobacteria bacterium]